MILEIERIEFENHLKVNPYFSQDFITLTPKTNLHGKEKIPGQFSQTFLPFYPG